MTRVFVEEAVVVPLLTKMRLPRWALLELGSQVAGERANVSPDDAPPVIGFETWRWGTRYCREHQALKELGWVACEEDQVSGIRNEHVRLKLVFCNTDYNTGHPIRPPKNTNEKGPASCRLISQNSGQMTLFPTDDKARFDLWYFCAHFNDRHIALEISRPTTEVGGIVANYSERIVVAQPGEIPGIRRNVVPQDFAEVPKPKVTRKGE